MGHLDAAFFAVLAEEVKRRLVVASPTYTVKVVDKDGIREIDLAA